MNLRIRVELFKLAVRLAKDPSVNVDTSVICNTDEERFFIDTYRILRHQFN